MGVAAAVTAGGFSAGCGEQTPQTPEAIAAARIQEAEAASQDPNNLYNILARASFTDQNEAPVNISALKAKFANSPTTLTFGFSRCRLACPVINNRLSELHKQHPGVKSIIISVDPADNASPSARQLFRNTLIKVGLAPENFVILYPQSPDAVYNTTVSVGGIANRAEPTAHDTSIYLFDPNGRKLASHSGLDTYPAIEAELGQHLEGISLKK